MIFFFFFSGFGGNTPVCAPDTLDRLHSPFKCLRVAMQHHGCSCRDPTSRPSSTSELSPCLRLPPL